MVASLGNLSKAHADSIVNGGFETGDFTGWTLGGDLSDPTTYGVDGSDPYTGNYAAYFGPYNTPITLSQTFATVTGQSYLVSYALQSEDGTEGNSFSATFGNTTLQSLENAPPFPYQLETFTVAASSSTTTLTFGFFNPDSYFDFDAVSVNAVPEPRSLMCSTMGVVAVGCYFWRNRRKQGCA